MCPYQGSDKMCEGLKRKRPSSLGQKRPRVEPGLAQLVRLEGEMPRSILCKSQLILNENTVKQ